MKLFVVNALLWFLSHLPVFCISDDKKFSTIKCDKDSNNNIIINDPHIRISLFSLMLGETIYYINSLDTDVTKIINGSHHNLIYKLELSKTEGCFLPDIFITRLMKNYRNHILLLRQDDLEIEKEKLLYHIQNEQHRKDRQIQKINIYSVIVMAVPTILIPVLFSKNIMIDDITSLPYPLLVIVGLMLYSYLNILLYIFSNVKITTIQKSSFRDLRNSNNRSLEIVAQYYYDWQSLKYNAELFVRYTANLQYWFIYLLVLSITFSVSLIMQ